MAKAAKADVDYSRGHGETRCGNCIYFEVEQPSTCTQVRGYIDRLYWCLRFKAPRPGATGPNQ
jgi:hypothetical protein